MIDPMITILSGGTGTPKLLQGIVKVTRSKKTKHNSEHSRK